MKFYFITNSTELATFAMANGADRIFVDLEIAGKELRQGHLSTVISRHAIADVARLRPHVPAGALLVRINPMNVDSNAEIDAVVSAGADIVMLPMFHEPAAVADFVRLVGGRARTILLVETVGAMQTLEQCVALPGVDEIHIGLNDLHLELRNSFMFEPLADGLVDTMAAILTRADIPFGIGGLARVGEGLLPAELILAEHARLGSTAAILSRTFHRQAASVAAIEADMDFGAEVQKLRAAYAEHCGSGPQHLQHQHLRAVEKIRMIAGAMPARANEAKQTPGPAYA